MEYTDESAVLLAGRTRGTTVHVNERMTQLVRVTRMYIGPVFIRYLIRFVTAPRQCLVVQCIFLVYWSPKLQYM